MTEVCFDGDVLDHDVGEEGLFFQVVNSEGHTQVLAVLGVRDGRLLTLKVLP